MYKVGVIGSRETVSGFGAIGFRAEFAESADEARAVAARLVRECAIIFVTEDIYVLAPDIAAAYREAATPAVVVIPGAGGGRGIGLEELRRTALRATGMDIL
ncbi:MAG: V-type ATP synthase subunit F [Clostridiales bacterium]|jgi:vacuolar-type H+-ATPase subunit F/Vma7|nr:V-type ATP synthase subunit F [Clostridiales bacterium]